MPDLASLIATFVAGLLAFLSPCTAPLLPAYLSIISGVAAVDLAESHGPSRFPGRLVLSSTLYVAGFASVLVILGFGAGGLAHAILDHRRLIEIVGGVLVAMLGLFILGVIRVPLLNREKHFVLPPSWRRLGVASAFPIGVVFGIGWTPCTGPYLATALVLAGASGTALTGAVLLSSYALGVGLPFIGVALVWASVPRLPERVRRLSVPLTRLGGLVTLALGVGAATGAYSHITSFFAQFATPTP